MKVPPTNSLGYSLFSLALLANSLVSVLIYPNPLIFAPFTIGVINPASVETATETSQLVNYLMKLPFHCELASGTAIQEREAALTIKSLTDTFTFSSLFNSFLKPMIESISTDTVK